MQYDPQVSPPVQPINQKKKKKPLVLFALSAGIAFAVLALAALGFFLYTGSQYDQAVACLSKQDYTGAQQKLSSVASFYKDTEKLKVYAQAGITMTAGKYDEARSLYGSLGAFRDSASMISEADYREASAWMESGEFDKAEGAFTKLAQAGYKDSKTMISENAYRRGSAFLETGDFEKAAESFTKLAETNYKDSAAMLKETKYRSALSLFEKKEYIPAFKSMQELGDYKDSANQLVAIGKEVYNEAANQYASADYASSRVGFSLVTSYNPDAKKYLQLIDAHILTKTDSRYSYKKTKLIYDQITALGNFADAQQLRVSDVFLPYRLEGKWVNKDKSFTFSVVFSVEKSCWLIYGHKQDDWYKLEDGKCYARTLGGNWLLDLVFRFISENECEVTRRPDDATYDGSHVFILTRS